MCLGICLRQPEAYVSVIGLQLGFIWLVFLCLCHDISETITNKLLKMDKTTAYKKWFKDKEFKPFVTILGHIKVHIYKWWNQC